MLRTLKKSIFIFVVFESLWNGRMPDLLYYVMNDL